MYRTFNTHLETCGKVAVRCSCGQDVYREVQELHRSESCPLTEMPCPFHLHGCRALVVRRDLDQHNAECAPIHLQLVLQTLQSVEMDKLQLSDKVQSLECRINVLTNTLTLLLEEKTEGNIWRSLSLAIVRLLPCQIYVTLISCIFLICYLSLQS
jgi:TRAF-type zinc finger